MKKLLTFVSLLLAFVLNVSAEGYGVLMEINMKNRPDKYLQVNRAPMRVYLDVVYDADGQCVTVNGDEDMDVEVFLYNSSGEIEDYSTSLNTTLFITTQGTHTITVETDEWVASGVIEV